MKEKTNEMPFTLKVADVAHLLGINKNSAYELAHREDFPSFRVGNRIVVPRDPFLEWMQIETKKALE